ncbi:MAG: rhodanese-like domain-containing protein [Verrucomicrobiae bacterium]|nr:rhodanese-like domain-containing protein [Verrucomicrobiae bacterium]
MRNYILVAVLACSPVAGGADEPVPPKEAEVSASAIKDISAVEANDYLSSDARARDKAVVLDIRTGKEFADGHIKGAMNLNFLGDDFKANLEKLDRDKVYVMHCQSGGRSGKAKALFKELGFKNVLHIQDGYRAWASAGFPVEKGASKE